MKKYVLMLILIFGALSFSACKKEDTPKTTEANENSMVNIYYPGAESVITGKERYQIKQPDSVTSSVEELMTCLMPYLDDRMEYHTYLLDGDDNLTLQFVCNGEYDKEYMLLSYAAITRTLFQVKDINSISISVTDLQGDTLENNFYLRNSFYFYDYQD